MRFRRALDRGNVTEALSAASELGSSAWPRRSISPRALRGTPRSVVIWRSVIFAGYVALAILVGIAYGGRGLLILSFFYFWAGAWVVFLLVWGWVVRAAGRWNFQRVDSAPSRRERDGSSSA
jgi:hypothetical protein